MKNPTAQNPLNKKKGRGIYTLAYAFHEQTALASDVLRVKKIIREHGVVGGESKIGTHLTVFPPFYATTVVAKTYAVMASVGGFFKKEDVNEISGVHVGWFPPPHEESLVEAIHLRVALSPEYVSFISRIKRSRFFEWVHPPARTSAVEPAFVPHIHLFEGENIFKQTEKHIADINYFLVNKHYKLGELRLFEKVLWKNKVGGRIITRWEQVLV